jgi:hypothetical protein
LELAGWSPEMSFLNTNLIENKKNFGAGQLARAQKWSFLNKELIKKKIFWS